MNGNDSGWHLDRRVPILIIGAFIIQSVALGYWAATLDGRINNVEKAQQERIATDRRQWDQIRVAGRKQSGMAEAISGMRSSLRNMERDIGRIFTILDAKNK